MPFARQKILILKKFSLWILSWVVPLVFYLKKSSLGHLGFLLCYLGGTLFCVLHLGLSMISFELVFVKGIRCVRFVSGFFFARGCTVVPALFVEVSILLHCIAFNPYQDPVIIFVLVFICSLYSVPLIYLPVLSLIPHCLGYYSFIGSQRQVALVLQLCSSHSILCWLFWMFCLSI